jgi:hypothetical protein
MRTAIALHELLPEGLYLECLSIETGRVGISAASRTRRSLCPLCSRGSSRVHSLRRDFNLSRGLVLASGWGG